ncbi:MAG: 1-acyl-sn-glycerol-3-phosphate acyltransferase [Enterobacterales bacterium]|nr:1-acyl-sn-glycerol-3-phosphate acyltransferase [Enterobacterales bacterium]
MKAYKAHRLRVAWIQLLTGIYTVWYSLRIVGAAFGRDKRNNITKLTRQWAKKLLGPTGLVLNVQGMENIEQSANQPTIVMCNHTSLYDIPVSFLALDVDLRMMAKKELFSIPILSAGLRAGDFVSIDRRNLEQAKKDLQIAKSKLEQNIVLWIAPEGTRSKDGHLKRFKKGGFHLAIDTQAQIIPVAIRGLDKILPSNSYDLTIHGEIDVVIGSAIDARGYNKQSCQELLDITHQALTDLLKVETSNE